MMSEQNIISSISTKGFLFAIMFCVIGTINALAQGEKERPITDVQKNSDAINTFENPESNSVELKSDFYLRQSTQNPSKDVKPSVSTQVRKENPLYKQGGEKDNKKEGMSTLSFNLFLYVVDKFREDN